MTLLRIWKKEWLFILSHSYFVSHMHLTARNEIKQGKRQIGNVVGKSNSRGHSMSFVFGLTWAARNEKGGCGGSPCPEEHEDKERPRACLLQTELGNAGSSHVFFLSTSVNTRGVVPFRCFKNGVLGRRGRP